MRSFLTVTIEGLGTGLVGAYGSNTAVTPAIDTLAAQGIVFDQCFVDSPDLLQQLTSLSTARHALQTGEFEASLWQLLTTAETPSTFITDNRQAASLAEQMGCPRVLLVEPPPNNEPEEEPGECAVMALFVAAAEELQTHPGGFVWIHSSGLRLPWDAPLELRNQFIDPDDPAPPADAQPPAFDITDAVDPDLVVGWGQVAAAQVAMLDDALASLRMVVASRADADTWAWCLIGLGGVPLGEHGRVGWGRPQLHGEELHCVAILCPTPAVAVGWRYADLCQLPDMAATIRECLGLVAEVKQGWGENLLRTHPYDTLTRSKDSAQIAVIQSAEGLVWIRSPAWSGLFPAEKFGADGQSMLNAASGRDSKLYVKPDDRWEVSEVADRCPEVVEELYEQAQAFLSAVAKNDRSSLPMIKEQLSNLMR